MIRLLIVLLLFQGSLASAKAITWNNRPIEVFLKPGQRTIVEVPVPVRFQKNPTYDQVDLVLVKNLIVIQPKPDQQPQGLLIAESIDDRGFILLDVKTEEDEWTQELTIEFEAVINETPAGPSDLEIDPKLYLTRFAVQQFYAPERVRITDPTITPVSVSRTPIQGIYRHGAFVISPVVGWVYQGYHITVLTVLNITSDRQRLDPNQLRANALTSAVINDQVAPGESTYLFVVSTSPLVRQW